MAEKLTFDQRLLELLEAAEAAGEAWRSSLKRLDGESDEVWLEQMYELDRLEAKYRTYQDQLCHQLRQALDNQLSFAM